MNIYNIVSIVGAIFLASCSGAQINSEAKSEEVKTEQEYVVKDISVAELHDKKVTIQILDVRTPEEVSEGKIKRAETVNIFDNDFIGQIESLNFDKNKELYVYCRSGGRSARAASQLNKKGFTKVYNVIGGITAWNAKKYPLVK